MIKNVSFAGKAYFLGDTAKTMTPEQKKRIEVYAQKQNYYRIQLSFPYLVFHSFFKKHCNICKIFQEIMFYHFYCWQFITL